MKKLLLIIFTAIILAGITKFAFASELIIKHDNNHYTHYHYAEKQNKERVYYVPATVFYNPSRSRVIRTYHEPIHYYSYSVSADEATDSRYYIH